MSDIALLLIERPFTATYRSPRSSRRRLVAASRPVRAQIHRQANVALQRIKSASATGARVHWHQDRGTVRSLYNLTFPLPPGTPEIAARQCLSDHCDLFGMTDPNIELRFDKIQNSLTGRHIRFHQYYKGIEVYGATISVHTNHSGRIRVIHRKERDNVMKVGRTYVLMFVAIALFGNYGCAKQKTSAQIDIVLTTTTPVVKMGQAPQFSISLTNRGKRSVTLVKPGEGSLYGWRTPIISWSGINDDYLSPRCGNISALKKEEVFKIDPGEKIQLYSRWTYPLFSLQLGTYEVAFNYENVPKLDWTDFSLGRPDRFALRRLRNSTPFKGTSNTVTIVVVE